MLQELGILPARNESFLIVIFCFAATENGFYMLSIYSIGSVVDPNEFIKNKAELFFMLENRSPLLHKRP
jgi:hypothetical protein